MIQTLLLFKWKLCYQVNQILITITTRSPSASLQINEAVDVAAQDLEVSRI